MTEEIKKPLIIRRKMKLPSPTEKVETQVKTPEPYIFFKEPLSKDEIIVKNTIEDLRKSLKDQEVICDFIDCEDKECSHNGKHNKLKMMHACRIPCGIHKEAMCI